MSLLQKVLGPREGFEGGLFLPDYKADTARRPIETIQARWPLRVPLRIAPDWATRAVVRPGQRVLRGTKLAIPAGLHSCAVHAPVSGTVTALDRVWSPRVGLLPCAIIEPDDRDEAEPSAISWNDESLPAQLADRGVVCVEPFMPAHVLLRQATAASISTLIVNAMETEPYLTADLRSLVEHPGRWIDMTCELADALGVHRAIFAVPYRHRRAVRRVEAEAHGRHVEVAALSDKYPQCHPVLLVKTLLDCEIAPGGTPLDAGAVVVPLSTIRMAAEAILDDRPVTHVLATVAGDAVEHAGTYRIPIGTTVEQLAQRVGLLGPVAQVVCGGPLTGITVARSDAVVTADTTAMLFFTEANAPRPVPCIRCGWCVEDCPIGLDPVTLGQLEARRETDATTLAHLRACIDCGLCSFVCPAELPLSATIERSRRRFGVSREAST